MNLVIPLVCLLSAILICFLLFYGRENFTPSQYNEEINKRNPQFLDKVGRCNKTWIECEKNRGNNCSQQHTDCLLSLG